MRIIAKLLLLSLEEDEEVVLNAVMSALGSFENKTQLKEEIACEKLAFKRMEIDASKRLVYRGEKEVNITFTEFEILHLLARNPGRVFSKEQIYDIVWNESYSGDYNIIISHNRNHSNDVKQLVKGVMIESYIEPGCLRELNSELGISQRAGILLTGFLEDFRRNFIQL